MKKTSQIFTLLLALTFVFVGCKKQVDDNNTDTDEIAAASSDDAEADALFTEVYNDVSGVNDEIAIANVEIGAGSEPDDPLRSHCYTITIKPLDPGIFPKTVTIDFGAGCLGRDGKTRKGKIITVFTGRLRIPGSKATTTFDGYYVNDVHVQGKHVIENKSTADVRIFTRTVIEGKLSKPNGNSIVWNATHTNTQTSGLGTPAYHWDDEYKITGNASGVSTWNGKTYEWGRQITEPLHKKANCRWFDKGIVSITHKTRTALLNFGDGTCDNKATITVGSFTKTIELR